MIKNRRGVILPAVLMIMFVLIMLGTILLESSLTSYKAAKSNTTFDYSYYSSEIFSKRMEDVLKKFEDETNAEPLVIDSLDAKEQIITSIEKKLGDFFKDDNNKIVKLGYSDYEKATLHDDDIEWFVIGEPVAIGNGVFKVTVGLAPKARDKDANQKVFIKKEIQVKFKSSFKLSAAIHAIGDVIVKDSSTPTINGDVNVYGSAPEMTNDFRQYLYGGIYAKNKAKLTINGNAITRSQLRVGPMNIGSVDGSGDGSTITVTKDVLAKGIQVYGRKDKLVVCGNAYTTDDLELNGEDSVIAINGNYFGVSQDGTYHDSSSAIVNNASVSFRSEPYDSLRSRIAINGDVYVNGSTFKVDPDEPSNVNLFVPIENASLAWDRNAWMGDLFGAPFYKKYLREVTDITDARNGYYEKLKDANISGYANLFQIWDKEKVKTNINSWLTQIDAVRDTLNIENKFSSISDKSLLKSNYPNEIGGYWKHTIACYGDEDDLYQHDTELNVEGVSGDSGVKNIDTWWKDSTKRPEPFSYTKYTDDNTDNIEELFTGVTDINYDTEVPIRLETLKDKIDNLGEEFVDRNDENVSGDNTTIENNSNGAFEKIFTESQKLGESPYLIRIPVDPASSLTGLKELMEANNNTVDSSGAKVEVAVEESKYYFVLNEDQNIPIEINYNFNGILVTRGKVYISSGVAINGSIIAAGGIAQFDTDGNISIKDATENIDPVTNESIGDLTEDNLAVAFDNSTTASITFVADDNADPIKYPQLNRRTADEARIYLINMLRFQTDPGYTTTEKYLDTTSNPGDGAFLKLELVI